MIGASGDGVRLYLDAVRRQPKWIGVIETPVIRSGIGRDGSSITGGAVTRKHSLAMHIRQGSGRSARTSRDDRRADRLGTW